ncbi:hypothetical protein MKW98_016631 [Papaver atlanticum]|uniref:Uncharacterized protein n=1 Tax=Papaver atlanticum TaxID=357466 RepID=A0AAD4XKN0_9MAGN|nr:hypothetical protein MKW98_016631 [Papaver atlanticum]
MAVKVCMVFFLLAAVVCLLAESSLTSSDMSSGGEVARSLTQKCNRMGGDCIGEDNDQLMVDSKINRRWSFQPKRHISYDAIKKDWVPCSKRGRSYYDCTKASKANPYNRGCTVATHCARIIR